MAQTTVNHTSAAEVGYDSYWVAWRRHTSSPLIVGCHTYDGKYSSPDIRRAYLRFNLDSTTWNSRVIDNAVFGIYHNLSVGTNTCTLHQASTEIDPTTGDISTVYSSAAGTSIGTISEGVGTWHTVNATAHARDHKGGFCDFGITGDATSNGNYDSWLNVTNLPRLVIDYYTPVNGRATAADAEIVGQATYADDLYQIHFRRNAGTGYRVVCSYVEYEEYSYAPQVQLQKLVSGTWTNIGSGVQSYSFMTTVTVRVEGSSIKVSDSDGLLIDTTDTTYSATGDWFVEDSTREVSYSEITAVTTETKTVTAKSRIKNTIAPTVTSKSRILDTETATISSKSRIAKPEPSTVTARARIQKTESATIQTRSRVLSTRDSEITSRARIYNTYSSFVESKAFIYREEEVAVYARARIATSSQSEVSSKALILHEKSVYIESRARIFGTQESTVDTQARIAEIGKAVLIAPEDESQIYSPVTLKWLIQDYLDYNVILYAEIYSSIGMQEEDLVLDIDSEHDPGFEYYNGSEWVTVSINGIPSGYEGNEVRVSVVLTPGVYYWRARNCAVSTESE